MRLMGRMRMQVQLLLLGKILWFNYLFIHTTIYPRKIINEVTNGHHLIMDHLDEHIKVCYLQAFGFNLKY